jgi:hypothetical protein
MSRVVLLVLAVALAVACSGCAAPGAGHLKRAPKGLPPSMAYLTGDAMGFSLLDANPDASAWKPLAKTVGEGEANRLLVQQHAGLFEDSAAASAADVAPWIGGHTGTLAYVLDVEPKDHGRAIEYWADVRSRAKLERFLTAQGWTKDSRHYDLGHGLTRWTRSGGDGLHALGVADDAVVGARSRSGLDALVTAAQHYSAKERNGMPDNVVEAAKRTPAAIVFRFDLVRTQLQRPFQDDPAMLELAKWATASNALVAIRDGWLGLAPAAPGAGDRHARLVGTWDWIPDLAPEIKLGEVGEAARNRLDPNADVAVALHDPGQFLKDELFVLTRGNIQYATKQDVAKGSDKVDLQPILDELDGDASISYSSATGVAATVDTTHSGAKADVESALRLAHVDSTVTAGPKGITVHAGAAGQRVTALDSTRQIDWAAAGAPPRAPIAWISLAQLPCGTPAYGWLTFNGVDRMSMSLDVSAQHGDTCRASLGPIALNWLVRLMPTAVIRSNIELDTDSIDAETP